MNSSLLLAQNDTTLEVHRIPYQDLKEHYENQFPVTLVESYKVHGDRKIPVEQIVLIRHAEPDLIKNDSYTSLQAQEYTIDYDTSAICAVTDPSCYMPPKPVVSKIYTSNLRRSIETAQALFPTLPLESRSLFRELEREMPVHRNPDKTRSLKGWQIRARIWYFLGRKYDDIEDWKTAKERIKKGATLLEQSADKEGFAVLVAHGLLNHFMDKRLRKRGWKKVRDGGNDYLSVTILARPVHKEDRH